MPKKLRVGLIGCGGIMRGHAQRLLELPEAEIAALTETNQEHLARFQQAVPQTAELLSFRDYRKMLLKVPLDAVVIATPHTLHFQEAMDALDHGCHLLVEKPMVCRVDHAKQLIAKAKRKRKVLMISYQRHYQPAFRYAKQLVEEGKLGKLTYITALQGQNWYGQRLTWRGDPKLSGGGQLNDSGSHLLDIILWVTGLVPQEVFAYINPIKARVDILSALSMKFKGGAIGTLSIVGHFPGWREDVTFVGMEGAMFIRDGRLLLERSGEGLKDVTEQCQYHNSADRNFILSILGKEKPQVPGICGLRVIQLTQAAWQSGAKGKPVQVEQ